MSIPVVDLFAGPGGLNEGFSSVGEAQGKPVFETVASVEMDASACNTLRLRGAYRRLCRSDGKSDTYMEFLRGVRSFEQLLQDRRFRLAYEAAASHVHELEMGPSNRKAATGLIRGSLASTLKADAPWVLVGGPPCQAYSLAGRSRRVNDLTFEDDHKHFLYREYLHMIASFAPPVFVMENVKGLLSSTHSGEAMFERILADLRRPGRGLRYEIHSLVVRRVDGEYEPSDYVIRSEAFGVPQRRHRVIVLGIRSDLASHIQSLTVLKAQPEFTVSDAIGHLPKLRSGVSGGDSQELWLDIRDAAVSAYFSGRGRRRGLKQLERGGDFVPAQEAAPKTRLESWLGNPKMDGYPQHETRTHMESDLLRYWFAAHFAERSGISPKLADFPRELLPQHANARQASRPFEDRFRVQVLDRPSTTVVSHIAKDGHYYIHPDAMQMRSLTVREAARLQTFPDTYFFAGTRTQQYHQVGNAVPPLLANQIADLVQSLF